MRATSHDSSNNDELPQLPVVPPKSTFRAAVQRFARLTSAPLALQFNPTNGHLLTLRPKDAGAFLWSERMWTADRGEHAKRFLDLPAVRSMLDLRHAQLGAPLVQPVPALDGFRASFQQEVTASDGRNLRVRHGYVDVSMDKQGRIFALTNSLRQGAHRVIDLAGIISDEQAIAAAKAKVGFSEYDIERAELVASSYDRPSKGKACSVRRTMEPVYEVALSAANPRRSRMLLVHARTAAVLHDESLTHSISLPRDLRRRFKRSKARTVVQAVRESLAWQLVNGLAVATASGTTRKRTATKVKGYALLRVPDPDVDIIDQYRKVIIESLPNPKQLANDNFRVFVGNRRTPVKAKADGTFNYKPDEPEFSAVVAFFALNIQWELMKKWGMTVPAGTGPADVRVEDASITDNAQFDQLTREISIGKGTGILTRYIAYDIGIVLHEGGHQIVYMLAPGNDLRGVEGAKCHEGLADLQTLQLDWWFQLKFARSLGYTIVVADISNSLRKIGAYAAPPDGIRQQKNTAKPTKTRDPHDGCLAIGGAMSDVLVELIETKGIETGIETFAKLMNGATAGVPRNKVTFVDLLSSFLAADDRQNNGANKPVIVQKFDDHDIRLPSTTGSGGNAASPIIVVNP